MVYNILNLGRTSLKAMQNDLDNTAHNIANSNTTGYKNKNTSFQELLNNNTLDNEVILSNKAKDFSVNAGVKNGVRTVNHKQGNLRSTGEKYNLAIEGHGFFGMRDKNDNLILTRNGTFYKDALGNICNSDGYKIDIFPVIDRENWGDGDFNVSSDGSITKEGKNNELLGKVILYKPENRNQLTPINETNFIVSNGNTINSVDSPQEFGKIIQGYVEDSNAYIGDSMLNLITTQRAYSANARAIQTVDDIAAMINDFKR